MPDQTSIDRNETASAMALPKNLPGLTRWAERRHIIDTKSLSLEEIECIMTVAAACKDLHDKGVAPLTVLKHKSVANLFYENSTRTRSSFELAARKLGASVLNLDINSSSAAKGESIADTARTLVSMGVNAVVQRHPASGSAAMLASALGDRVCVINAGDGWNAHPTQALLDLFSMREVKPSVLGTKVAIVGDIRHSRVARSNIWLLQKLGVDIHLCGPPSLVPRHFSELGVVVERRLEAAVEDADFIIALRLQTERQQQGLIPSLSEYKSLYRLDHERIRNAKSDVKVLHPGPVNRGVEITEALLDDANYSLVSRQVTNGIAIRMALLYVLLGNS